MRPEDGPGIAALVRDTGVLDPNSTYAYVLLGDRFGEHGVVAEDAEGLAGFVTGFLDPRDSRILFLWQIGVVSRARGRGLASRLLDAFVEREAHLEATALETTIAVGNAPSEALFRAFARRRSADLRQIDLYPSAWLDDHPSERVMRIAPLRGSPPHPDAHRG